MGTISKVSLKQGDAVDAGSTPHYGSVQSPLKRTRRSLTWAFVALLLFICIYCARPEDFVPALANVPLGKIAGVLILLALAVSLQHIRHAFPRVVIYLILLIAQLFLAAALSPVWRGGAVQATLEFAKIPVIVVVIVATVQSLNRLRLLILIQALSVAAISGAALFKGRLLLGRLEGVLAGNYANPNDLALSIAVSIPLCLALLFITKNWFWKAVWALAILEMIAAVFLTGSRGGFLALVGTTIVCLWEFAIRGRRRYVLLIAALAGLIFWQSSSGILVDRFRGTFDEKNDASSAYGSAQERQQLFWRSIDVTKEHPVFGIGPGNFPIVSGNWHVTHNSFTQMSSEGGVPAFILFVLILWRGFASAQATKGLARGRNKLIVLAGALQASLVAYLIASIFSSAAYQFYPYLLVAYSAALQRIARNTGPYSKMQMRRGSESAEYSFEHTVSGRELSTYPV